MATQLQHLVAELEANICQVVLGKADVVRMCVVALLAGDHVLLEDVPGVGKTLIGKALAKSISASFSRIQFTSDLLAQRHHGRQRLQPADRAVRVHARADLRQHRAGRRDQPHAAAHAERPAGGDERPPGDDRRPDQSAAAAVHGDRHAEPVRVRGHVSAAGKPARSIPAADCRGLSRSGRRAAGAGQPPCGRAGGHAAAGARCAAGGRRAASGSRGVDGREHQQLPVGHRGGHAATATSCAWA